MVVRMDRELSDWLDGKAMMGYKKSLLIRRILREYARNEGTMNG